MNQNLMSMEAQNQGLSPVAGIESNRAMKEVEGAIVLAKRFPRDEEKAIGKILEACQHIELAREAQYVYPRGGEIVTGPSIRLAEAMALRWGNLDYGTIEISQRRSETDPNITESVMQAFAWDYESNTRSRKVFTVPHIRYSKRRGNAKLFDPRDIYEMAANQGARRLRACILATIPIHVQDMACKACDATVAKAQKEPIGERIPKMVGAFAKYGVNKDMIEKRLGHVIGKTSEAELVQLGKIFTSIKDNMASPADYFDVAADPQEAEAGKSAAETLAEKLKSESEDQPDPPLKEEESDGEDASIVDGPIAPETYGMVEDGESAIGLTKTGRKKYLGKEFGKNNLDDLTDAEGLR